MRSGTLTLRASSGPPRTDEGTKANIKKDFSAQYFNQGLFTEHPINEG
jgi:hypothetical protein